MKNPLRYAAEYDSKGITELIRTIGWFDAVNKTTFEEAHLKIKRDLDFCLLHPESHSVYIYESMECEIIGYVNVHWIPMMILSGPEGYISELFIHPDYQGKGIGSALLDTIKQDAQTRGCKRLSLLNAKHRLSYQRQFYTKQGWQERDTMANFIYLLPTD